jgi:6,7-dimethyl-8-ribityllumazine synthase
MLEVRMDATYDRRFDMRSDPTIQHDRPDAANRCAAIVVSRYHTEITDLLEEGARKAFLEAGGSADHLAIADAPGAFELVAIASAWARRPEIDVVVTLGCIVTGETRHDRYLAAAVAESLANLSSELSKPIAFGVLTVSDLDQARARCGGAHGHKGRESMQAALAAASAIDAARGWRPNSGSRSAPSAAATARPSSP